MTNFDEYIRQGEPSRIEKAQAWRTAIGLQAVDGLKTSDYLRETARRHIEGEITIDDARRLITSYYQSKTRREPDEAGRQTLCRPTSHRFCQLKRLTSAPKDSFRFIAAFLMAFSSTPGNCATTISVSRSGCLRAHR